MNFRVGIDAMKIPVNFPVPCTYRGRAALQRYVSIKERNSLLAAEGEPIKLPLHCLQNTTVLFP
jgi:hypothetical protein